MVKKEALEGMTAEQVMQQLQEVKERRRVAIERANSAISGYQKAVDMRDAKIKELRDDLDKQLTGIADKAAALNAEMLKASLAGDSVEQGKAQAALNKLGGQRSQLTARMEMLNGKPPRCDEEYAAMESAVAESEKAIKQYSEDASVIEKYCEDSIQAWEKITSAVRSYSDVHRSALDRARQHYGHDR